MEKLFALLVGGGETNKITKKYELRHYLIKPTCNESVSASTIKNIDFATLPTSRVCLEQHVWLANYKVGIWKLPNTGIYELPKQ